MATKRSPKTGQEALDAMVAARYSYQAISDNMKLHADESRDRSMLNLMKHGKRNIPEGVEKALIKTAKALEVKVAV